MSLLLYLILFVRITISENHHSSNLTYPHVPQFRV